MSKLSPSAPNFYHLNKKINPLAEIENAGIVTSGNVFWVKDPSDDDYVSLKEAVGKENLFDTIQPAIDKCTADQNDYVMVCPKKDGSTWAQGTALDLNVPRVHLWSVGHSGRSHGYSNTIEGYVAASVMDTELVHVTQEGVEISGFRILATAGTSAAGSITNGLLYLSGSAHDLVVNDCEIENTGTDWDDDGPASIVGGAASQHRATFNNCLIGGTVAEGSGTQTPVICSASGKRWEFNNCKFLMDSGHAGQKFAVAGTGKIDYLLFDRCKFMNIDQANLITSAITGNVTDDQGVVLMDNCSAINVTAFGTDDNCWVVPNIPGTAGPDVGITNPGLAVIGTAAVAI